MFGIQGEISSIVLAKYNALLHYASAWRNLDLRPLNEALTPDVIFDAPGIPFNIIGKDKVVESHKLFFDNLHCREVQLSKGGILMNSYNVITQIYPYEHKEVIPFMQLSYYTDCGFLKLVYFFIDLDKNLKKIRKINTHRTKFLVDSSNYLKEVSQIQELYYSQNLRNHE